MDHKNAGRVTAATTLNKEQATDAAQKSTGKKVNKFIKNDVSTALHDSAVLFWDHEGRLQTGYTTEIDYVMNVVGVVNLVEMIIRTNAKLFSIQTNKFNKSRYIELTKMGDRLLSALRIDVPSIRQSYHQHLFHPYFELFVRRARERDLDHLVYLRHALTTEEITRSNDVLQGFVSALREEGRSAKFKATLRRFQRGPNKNCQGLIRYLRKNLAQQGKINIRRYDLSYRRDGSLLTVPPCVTDHQTAKTQREAFIKALRKSELGKCGYAWKLEHSDCKGFMHHFLLVLDEASVERQEEIDAVLRKIWNEVTDDTGLLIACNLLSPFYKNEGVGLLSNDDNEAWLIIRRIAIYMTQTDNYIKLNLPGNARAFGKAEFVGRSSATEDATV